MVLRIFTLYADIVLYLIKNSVLLLGNQLLNAV
jgi:hypothetical protein